MISGLLHQGVSLGAEPRANLSVNLAACRMLIKITAESDIPAAVGTGFIESLHSLAQAMYVRRGLGVLRTSGPHVVLSAIV